MASLLAITPKELQRQAALALEGRPYRVFLASNPGGTLGVGSTTAAWEAVKLPVENGYADAVGTVEIGSYNMATGRYELPAINAQFTGTGTGFTYNSLILVIDNAEYPHSILQLSIPQTLASSQLKSYLISLVQDD